MKTVARMRDEALLSKLLEQEDAAARDRALNRFLKVSAALLVAGLLAMFSACATPQHHCYVPMSKHVGPTDDARELDAAACTASTLTFDQNVACMRLRGYRAQLCNAAGDVVEPWVSVR